MAFMCVTCKTSLGTSVKKAEDHKRENPTHDVVSRRIVVTRVAVAAAAPAVESSMPDPAEYFRVWGGTLDSEYAASLAPNEQYTDIGRIACHEWSPETEKPEPVKPHNVRHKDCSRLKPCGCYFHWERNADGAQTTGWKLYVRCRFHQAEFLKAVAR